MVIGPCLGLQTAAEAGLPGVTKQIGATSSNDCQYERTLLQQVLAEQRRTRHDVESLKKTSGPSPHPAVGLQRLLSPQGPQGSAKKDSAEKQLGEGTMDAEESIVWHSLEKEKGRASKSKHVFVAGFAAGKKEAENAVSELKGKVEQLQGVKTQNKKTNPKTTKCKERKDRTKCGPETKWCSGWDMRRYSAYYGYSGNGAFIKGAII